MPAPYAKPYLTIPRQIALLESRGMRCRDHDAAASALRRYGYYRLSGYWYPFRHFDSASGGVLETFKPGTCIEHAIALAAFDKKLRLLVLDALEQIEVALRVDVALIIGHHDALAHREARFLHPTFASRPNLATGQTPHQEWLARHDKTIDRSHEDFVQNYKSKYSTPLPIWMAIELWDFGLLSRFIGLMTVPDRQNLAARYAIADWRLLESWVRSLGQIRNVAAHHSRLWNRALINLSTPKMPQAGTMAGLDHLHQNSFAQKRLYVVAAVIQHFIQQIELGSAWADSLSTLFATFPVLPDVEVGDTGFPQDWQKQPLWQTPASP
jgi:abortive infection bacteriophage resistance protein